MIKIHVYNKNITAECELVSGTVAESIIFTFTSDWKDKNKCVSFRLISSDGSQTVEDLPVMILDKNQTTAEMPWECLRDEYVGHQLFIGVAGFTDAIVYPTTFFPIGRISPGAKTDGPQPTTPTTPLVADIYTKAAHAESVATEVYRMANAGEFKGEKGDPYTHSEEFENLSIQIHADANAAEKFCSESQIQASNAHKSAEQAGLSENSAKISELNAENSAQKSKESETQSSQNLSDLLHTIGTSVPSLVDGKIPMSQIPATATTEIFVVTAKDELTGLNAQKGDLAELIESVSGEQTITKTWQLLNNDPSRIENWVVWGTSYAVQAGSATIAETANNAERINGMRLVTMNYSDFQTAVKDPDTLYAVDMEA